MSMNQAFIDWIKLTPQTEPEENKQYLVVESSEGNASYTIATYYKAGTKVSLELTEEELDKKKLKNNMTSKERLLLNIFCSKDMEIMEDGFYRITKDYGMDEDAYPGCAEIPIPFGLTKDCDTWYAELPVEPEGLKHPYEVERETKLQLEHYKQELAEQQALQQEKWDKARQKAVSDGGIVDRMARIHKAEPDDKTQYDYMRNKFPEGTDIKDRDNNVHPNCFEYEGCIFEANKDEWNMIYATAAQSVTIYQTLQDKYSNQDIIDAHMKARNGDSKGYEEMHMNITKLINNLDEIGATNYSNDIYRVFMTWTFLDTPFMENGNRGPKYWHKRLMKYSWYKNLSIADQIVLSYSMFDAGLKLRRCAKLDILMNNNYPVIIAANELRMLFENMYYIMAHIQGYTFRYEDRFGHTPDGTYVGFKDDEPEIDTHEPPFPDNLPESDEYGIIPYAYNRETGQWEDQRDPAWLQDKKEETERTEKTADELMSLVKKLADKSYNDIDEFATDMKNNFAYNLYLHVVKITENKVAIRICADIGIYDLTIITVFANKDNSPVYEENKYFKFDTVYFPIDKSDVYENLFPATKGTNMKYVLIPN